MQVDDPCKAQDNSSPQNSTISLTPGKTIVKDLKYYSGTDSTFWLPLCTGLKALRFVKPFPFIELVNGNLAIFSTPSDLCTRLEV